MPDAGHHRRDEAVAEGRTHVPAVLLPDGLSADDADLAMLSFNVHGAEVEDLYFDFVASLEARVGRDAVATFAAVDAEQGSCGSDSVTP